MPDIGVEQRRLIIGKQLEKKKDLIRALFRACGDRTVGAGYQTREQLPEDPAASAEKTIFEKVDAISRPVIFPVRAVKVLWKKKQLKSTRSRRRRSRRFRKSRRTERRSRINQPTNRDAERNGIQNLPRLADAVCQREFATAYKVMIYVKKCGILDHILSEEGTEKIRQFFETELSFPSYQVMRLLHEAFNKCWEKIMDDCKKVEFSQDILLFLSEREKAKASFLDVMLVFPEHIPESWGGRHIVEISVPSGSVVPPAEVLNVSLDSAAPLSHMGIFPHSTALPEVITAPNRKQNVVPDGSGEKKEPSKGPRTIIQRTKASQVKSSIAEAQRKQAEKSDTPKEYVFKQKEDDLKKNAKIGKEEEIDIKKVHLKEKQEASVNIGLEEGKEVRDKEKRDKKKKDMKDMKETEEQVTSYALLKDQELAQNDGGAEQNGENQNKNQEES